MADLYLREDAVFSRFEAIYKKMVQKAEEANEQRSYRDLAPIQIDLGNLKDQAMIFAIVREINQEPLDWEDR